MAEDQSQLALSSGSAVRSATIDLGSKRFWLTQIIGWSALHNILFLPRDTMAEVVGATQLQMFLANEFNAITAIIVSTWLARIFVRTSDSEIQSRSGALRRVVLPCLLGGAFITVANILFVVYSGQGPWMPKEMNALVMFPTFVMVSSTLSLATWSAVFLVVLLNRRVQFERARAAVADSLASEARLGLLRSQVNPHFLFNALNSIVGLIGEDPEKAEQMVRDVAALLRRALDDNGDTHSTVADEIEFINLYLRCQKVRFEERLEVEVEVDETLLNKPLPRMLLHPLVENAVKHGMRGGKPLKLRVLGRLEGEKVFFEVANTGQLVQQKPEATYSDAGTGVNTVRTRVAAIYPDGDFSLREDDGWVVAQIRYSLPQGIQ